MLREKIENIRKHRKELIIETHIDKKQDMLAKKFTSSQKWAKLGKKPKATIELRKSFGPVQQQTEPCLLMYT